jgi:hypothetical protein
MFTSSLPPVVCKRALVLFTLCSLRLYLQLLVGGLMSYLRYLCLFTYSDVQYILCCVLFCFSLSYVASFSGLSIFDCPFGLLYRLYIL